MSQRSVINNYAPQCAYDGCITRVQYHNVEKNLDGGFSVQWKNCCESHRKERKSEVDNWKLKEGCINVDARYGFKCTATILYPEQLDINHIDGDRHNNDPANKEIICKNCHARVTIQSKHHLNRYTYNTYLPSELFEQS
jgi:hypothetical protein